MQSRQFFYNYPLSPFLHHRHFFFILYRFTIFLLQAKPTLTLTKHPIPTFAQTSTLHYFTSAIFLPPFFYLTSPSKHKKIKLIQHTRFLSRFLSRYSLPALINHLILLPTILIWVLFRRKLPVGNRKYKMAWERGGHIFFSFVFFSNSCLYVNNRLPVSSADGVGGQQCEVGERGGGGGEQKERERGVS